MNLRPPLTAPALRRALIAGARRVIASRDGLNRINVFPVADGDTGNNLAHTLGSLLNGALSRRSRHIGELLLRIGNDAIDGARGNSGAILAQFLHGVAEHARSQPVLDATTLAASVRRGADSARAALAQPVEGTILSVISAFADALDEAARGAEGGDPRPGFASALASARVALARTPQQMALLQKAGVVDAGAQGFVDLLEGIAEFVDGGPRALRVHGAAAAANEAPAPADAHPAHEHVDPERRWCAECLVLGEGIERDALRAAIEAVGADSLVLAGGAARMRVHAHVGRPQQLFDACAGHGAVEGMKADDMLLQQRSTESGLRLAVLTDSAADLPETVLERHAVHVVPVRVSVDGRDYLDKVGLTTAEFYRRMAASADLPKTSQPPPGDFRRPFDFLLAHHPQLIYVGLSRAVSGTLQSGEHAAARADAARVHVFDSINAAGGQALLAWRAAELAEAGADLAAVLAELERLRPLTLTWAMARDISHAVRGGRIPAWAGPVVRYSGLTPVARMKADGRLGVAGGLLARRSAPEKFAGYVARRLPGGTRWRAIVGHCDAHDDGTRLLECLRRRVELSEAHLVETGPAIGAHAGRGALLVSVQPAP
ncbi:DegV family protein [Lysobacter silvisoli]|uniref:DegV family EDD domain-containing protein n=1 Tax=Lysobacter silvisoli TaxID=2293254 RepID=A0A371JZV4_9GAMM|nr:DegV family protein [Lysobacter silvisoli]RDZ27205.1 DegV family EDD domain-containing protein [Lysobacter silvisoli]